MIPSVAEIYREIFVEPGETAKRLAERYGYRPYMVQRYIQMLGLGGALKLLEAFERPLKPVVRANTRLVEPEKLKKRLEALGFSLEEVEWAPLAFRVVEAPPSPSLGATHEYLKGLYYKHRDSSSLLPVVLLAHDYSGDVLDACAAPGGKATFLAQLVGGTVYANDLSLPRLRALVGHFMRMRLPNVAVTWADARRLPSKTARRFERVLLDAPCSAEGTIMVDPGRKTRTTLRDLAVLARREIELLLASVEMLADEGVVAYVTCSIAPEENEYVVTKVLELRGDVEVVEPPARPVEWDPWLREFHGLEFDPSLSKCARLWPHKHGTFGFSLCLLRRTRR